MWFTAMIVATCYKPRTAHAKTLVMRWAGGWSASNGTTTSQSRFKSQLAPKK